MNDAGGFACCHRRADSSCTPIVFSVPMQRACLLTASLLLLLAWPQGLRAQDAPPTFTTSQSSWATGDPSPFPVRISFFSSRPGNALDTTAVKNAARTALMFEGLPPDVAFVPAFGARDPQQPHLQVEVNVYSGGEIRVEQRVAEGEQIRGCREESQGSNNDPVSAALVLSHRIRGAIRCAPRPQPEGPGRVSGELLGGLWITPRYE